MVQIRTSSTTAVILAMCLMAASFHLPPAYGEGQLGLGSRLLSLTPPIETNSLLGLRLHPNDSTRLDFLFKQATKNELTTQEIRQQIEYFFIGMSLPNDQLWVNLSPYEQDRMIAPLLAETRMGQIMLKQDLILKRLTASLLHPQSESGQKFWAQVYLQAQEKSGQALTKMPTIQKVWIVPDTTELYINGRTVSIVKSQLRVMVEDDYLALSQHHALNAHLTQPVSPSSTNAFKQYILPILEKEVNEGSHFVPVRQMLNALILAKWFKEHNHPLAVGLANKSEIENLRLNAPVAQKNKDMIFKKYTRLFKDGEFNFIQDDAQTKTPRKYIAGGIKLQINSNESEKPNSYDGPVKAVRVQLRPHHPSRAMMGLTRDQLDKEYDSIKGTEANKRVHLVYFLRALLDLDANGGKNFIKDHQADIENKLSQSLPYWQSLYLQYQSFRDVIGAKKIEQVKMLLMNYINVTDDQQGGYQMGDSKFEAAVQGVRLGATILNEYFVRQSVDLLNQVTFGNRAESLREDIAVTIADSNLFSLEKRQEAIKYLMDVLNDTRSEKIISSEKPFLIYLIMKMKSEDNIVHELKNAAVETLLRLRDYKIKEGIKYDLDIFLSFIAQDKPKEMNDREKSANLKAVLQHDTIQNLSDLLNKMNGPTVNFTKTSLEEVKREIKDSKILINVLNSKGVDFKDVLGLFPLNFDDEHYEAYRFTFPNEVIMVLFDKAMNIDKPQDVGGIDLNGGKIKVTLAKENKQAKYNYAQFGKWEGARGVEMSILTIQDGKGLSIWFDSK